MTTSRRIRDVSESKTIGSVINEEELKPIHQKQESSNGVGSSSSGAFTLIICTIGIYISFITWSILQEKISTTGYGQNNDEIFKLPLVINIVQSFFACIVGSIYLSLKLSKLTSPLQIFIDENNCGKFNSTIFKYFLLISITQSISSPIGLQSLLYVDYLIYLLAKSCKLIPVMLVQTFLFGKKFPTYKHAVALSITLGVSIFTLFKSGNGSGKNGDGYDSNNNNGVSLLIGLGYLGVSMFLDGLTNSAQDQLFKLKEPGIKITGAHLMSGLNFLNCLLTSIYALLFTNQITYALQFIKLYPDLLSNIVLFGIFGSIGQIFIFVTLEKFDSIVLITVTVTRKMFSMILSVIVFGHVLNYMQWFGVSLVFGGIGFEAWLKSQIQKKN